MTTLYDFASAGEGSFEFIPNTSFQVLDKASIEATAASITIEITGDIPRRESHTERSNVACKHPTKSKFIERSYHESKELANVAIHSLSHGKTKTFEAYFSHNNISSVIDVLSAVAKESDSSRGLHCSDKYEACDGHVIAYAALPSSNVPSVSWLSWGIRMLTYMHVDLLLRDLL